MSNTRPAPPPKAGRSAEPPAVETLGQWRLLLLCALVGVVAGVGAIGFHLMLDLARDAFMGHIAGYSPELASSDKTLLPEPSRAFNRWVFFFLPAAGGLISGWLVFRFAPEAAGHGTDAAIESYHRRGGVVKTRVPFIKALTAAITIGTGGSAGREGPIAQIGAGFGSMLGRWLTLRPRDLRTLMAAGMGAGVGAIFAAPLAGALFSAEVLYRDLDLEYEVIMPSVIASAIAYSVFALWFGWTPVLATPDFSFRHAGQLVPYTLLAGVVAVGAIAFIKIFYTVHDAFGRLPVRPWLKPAIGGLLVGVVGLFAPEALGTSFGMLERAINLDSAAATAGALGIGALAMLAGAKIIATSFSIGSGGSGGVFGPSVVIGGALGGVVGLAAMWLFPGFDVQPGAFVLVGMAGFFAAAANTPISTIIIVSEMTHNYHLLLPSMWVCILAYLLTRRFQLYRSQIASRFDATIHAGSMVRGVLGNITVGEALAEIDRPPLETLPDTAPLDAVLAHFGASERGAFPVVTDSGELVGLICERHLRPVLNSPPGLHHALIASDLARPPVTVTEADTLRECLRRLARFDDDEAVVVAPGTPARPLAMLGVVDIVAAMNRRMHADEHEAPGKR